MRECGWGCWLSVLPFHHSTEVESNLVMALFAINYFLVYPPHPLSLVVYYVFHLSNPTPALTLYRTACA